MSVTIKTLQASDISDLATAFLNTVWKTPASHFERMLAAQANGEIAFLVARIEDTIAGFLFIKWQADYPPFAEKGIPEIRDLRVLQQFCRRGVATALMDEAEKRIFMKSKQVGLGVGLYADYGPAQRMYILRGYVPDGRGLMYNNLPVNPGRDVFVDDELLLYFIKERK
jgi:GNAT superfamily N-acetyltransferase